MDKIYIRDAFTGQVTVWEKDFNDNMRKAFSQHVCREVRDSFEFHRCDRVEYDGWGKTRPMFNTHVDVPVVIERRVEVPVVIERRVPVVVRHDDNTAAAALFGMVVGAAFGAAAAGRRQGRKSV